jgi:hypothetical protein
MTYLGDQLSVLVAATAPMLLARPGVGTDTAGALLVAAGGNPERLDTEAAFAHLCGVSPIEASSGKVTRHRLDRGGDRQANQALWRIVMVRTARASTFTECASSCHYRTGPRPGDHANGGVCSSWPFARPPSSSYGRGIECPSTARAIRRDVDTPGYSSMAMTLFT